MNKKQSFKVKIRSLSPEVTGSGFIIRIYYSSGNISNIGIECGMFQEKRHESLNSILSFNPADLETVIVTHSHLDHCGRLPLLTKKGFRGPIYSSYMTSKAIPLILYDSAKILEKEYEKKIHRYSNNYAKKYNSGNKRRNKKYKNGVARRGLAVKETPPPLYRDLDVDTMLSQLTYVNYDKWQYIGKGGNTKFKLFKVPHIPGASMVLLEIKDDITDKITRFLFTGDWKQENLLQGKLEFPEEIKDLNVNIITESTYALRGDDEPKPVFKEQLKEALREKHTVILPIIAQYRAQEMQYMIKTMQNNGEISPKVRVCLIGTLGVEFNHLFRSDTSNELIAERQDFVPNNFQELHCSGLEAFIPHKNSIYLVTGGLGSNGPSETVIKRVLRNRKVSILFSNYFIPGTVADILYRAEEGDLIKIGGQIIMKLAKVSYTSEFSGHARLDHMLDFISKFSNIQSVLVTHGATKAKLYMKTELDNLKNVKRAEVIDRQTSFIFNETGIIKKCDWVD